MACVQSMHASVNACIRPCWLRMRMFCMGPRHMRVFCHIEMHPADPPAFKNTPNPPLNPSPHTDTHTSHTQSTHELGCTRFQPHHACPPCAPRRVAMPGLSSPGSPGSMMLPHHMPRHMQPRRSWETGVGPTPERRISTGHMMRPGMEKSAGMAQMLKLQAGAPASAAAAARYWSETGTQGARPALAAGGGSLKADREQNLRWAHQRHPLHSSCTCTHQRR